MTREEALKRFEGKIGRIAGNDLENISNLLAGKFGWSGKDPERRFYMQNVIIGRVSETPVKNEDGELVYYVEPYYANT